MRFRFRLQRLLSLRQQQVKLASQSTARAQAALREAETELAGRQQWLQERSEQLLQEAAAGLPVQQWLAAWRHLEGLQRQVRRAADQVAGAEARWQQSRTALVQARQAEETLARLRERDWQRHQAEQARAEQRFLDDLPSPGGLAAWSE